MKVPKEYSKKIKSILNDMPDLSNVTFKDIYAKLEQEYNKEKLETFRSGLKKKSGKIIQKLQEQREESEELKSGNKHPIESRSPQKKDEIHKPPQKKENSEIAPDKKEVKDSKSLLVPKEDETKNNRSPQTEDDTLHETKKKMAKTAGDQAIEEAFEFLGNLPTTRTTRSRSSPKKKTTTHKEPKKRKASDDSVDSTQKKKVGFNVDVYLSAPLSEFLDVEKCPRGEVTKRLTAYVKENDLQNPKDKRKIIFDEKLESIFKCKTTTFFKIVNEFFPIHYNSFLKL